MEKNLLKRVLCTVLAAATLCLLLAGCGGGKSSGDGYVYVPSYLSLPDEIIEMNSPTISGDTIYFTQNKYYDADGKEVSADDYNNEIERINSSLPDTPVVSDTDIPHQDAPTPNITPKMVICSVKTDGTGYTEYPDYKAPEYNDKGEGGGLSFLLVDQQGNLWGLEYKSIVKYDFPEGVDESSENAWQYANHTEQYNLCKLSETGKKVAEIDLNSFIEKQDEDSYFYINYNSIVFDKDSNICFTDGNGTVYVVDPSGALLFKLNDQNGINTLLKLKDNSIAAALYDSEHKSCLKVVDIASKNWGETKAMPSDAYNLSSGGAAYDFCYQNGTSLFGYDCNAEAETKILTWVNCDIDGNNIQFSTVKENGDVLVVSTDWSEDGPKYEVITLVKTPADQVKQKTTLTFATMSLNYEIMPLIIKFNKENPDYRIEIADYSEFNTEEDYKAGATKLNTEIISGNVPDIISIDNLPYKQYAAKGLLEDLYPFIDNDSDISRDNFIQSILKATESGGKLYTLSPTFNVMSIIGASSVVGDKPGWTLDDMQKIMEQHHEADFPFGAYMTRDNILQYICMLNLDSFMDWQTGQCSFDSEGFKNLLKFSSTFPESIEYPENGENYLDESTLISDGRQLFSFYTSSDFTDYQWYKALFGGAITYKGLPTEKGVGNIARITGGIAMTTSCKHKDGAWQFIKMLLDEKYQNGMWGYPITQSAFDKKLTDAMDLYQKDGDGNYILDENGEKIPASGGGMSSENFSVEFGPITREDADQITALISSVEHTATFDDELINIITEETAAYFAGEKSLDETASVIQSRISIYINEQR